MAKKLNLALLFLAGDLSSPAERKSLMTENRCDFCEKNQPIVNIDITNDYQFSLPIFSRTLVITDKKRSREYLYGITYCPICGRKVT